MNIQGTNFTFTGGEYVINFLSMISTIENGVNVSKYVGETVVCRDYKKAVKKYKKAGYYVSSATLFENRDGGLFFLLNKSFGYRTKRGMKINIANEMFHIQNSLNDNTLKFEM